MMISFETGPSLSLASLSFLISGLSLIYLFSVVINRMNNKGVIMGYAVLA